MTVDLLLRIIEVYPQFIGIKNDTDDEYLQTAYLHAAPEEFAVITGGMMRPFVLGSQFGQRCYADIFAMFQPEISLRFFSFIEHGQIADAVQIIKRYEMPWSDFTIFGRRKFDAKSTLKTILWLTGHFATNRVRFPRVTQRTDGPEVAAIREFLHQLEIRTCR
jgi:dihydrodipicolinate synthase/N-acetylneuraminate lyase